MHRVVMTLATIFVIWYLILQSPNTMGSMQSRNKSIDFKNNTKPLSLCATDFTVNFDWRKCFHNLDLLSKLSVGGSGCLDQKTLYWLTQGCSRLKRCLMLFFYMASVVRGLQERWHVYNQSILQVSSNIDADNLQRKYHQRSWSTSCQCWPE